jgi:hypothetical protein
MSGSPMRRRVLAALQSRATREGGEGASITDFATKFFASGRHMQDLADLLALDLGHPVSRSFLSGILNNAPDAAARLDAARREARALQAEQENRLIQLRAEVEAQRRHPPGVKRPKDEPSTAVSAA